MDRMWLETDAKDVHDSTGQRDRVHQEAYSP